MGLTNFHHFHVKWIFQHNQNQHKTKHGFAISRGPTLRVTVKYKGMRKTSSESF